MPSLHHADSMEHTLRVYTPFLLCGSCMTHDHNVNPWHHCWPCMCMECTLPHICVGSVELLNLVRMQVQAHEVRKCTDLLSKVAEDIQARQRDMSRDVIEPTVQRSMTGGYAACCAEVGPGQYDRMRRLMTSAVEHHKGSMFAEAAGLLFTCAYMLLRARRLFGQASL